MLSVSDLLGGSGGRDELLRTASEKAHRDLVALAMLGVTIVDPLKRLLDPTFSDVVWLYDFSKVGPEVPGSLHAKQWEALTNPAKHRWLFWGNQVGKTTLGAVDQVLKALGRHPLQLAGVRHMPPWNAWASALTWELWQNILLPELLTWIPVERIVDAPPPYRQSSKRDIVIRADNGKLSRITGKAAEQGSERYQSARLDDAWLDEEHPESVWDELQPRMLRFGGTTLGTMTPLKGFTWVHGRVYEPWKAGRLSPERHWCQHAGLKDNPSIQPAAIAELEEELKHNPSQLAARLEGLFVRPIGAVWPFDLEKHARSLGETPAQVMAKLDGLAATARHYGGIDLGKWRWTFLWGVVGPDGDLGIVGQVFSQNEDTDTRARRLHELLQTYHVPGDRITIRADNADPKSIAELNASLERIDSPYYVAGVEAHSKIRAAGILRVESLMNRGAFWVLRTLGQGEVWRLGMGAAKPGKPVEGSRLIWELNNWQYPKTEDGKVQKDDPDDATADGADSCDALRYLVMTWLGPLDVEKPRTHPTPEQEIWKEALQDHSEDDDEDAYAGTSEYGDIVQEG